MNVDSAVAKPNNMVQSKPVYTQEQVGLIKRLIGKDLTNDELLIFLHNCQKTGLDPLAKQIYAIKRKTKYGDVMTIQTGIDGFRLIAERTGKYAPGKDTEFLYQDGSLIGAKAYVKKQTPDGTWHDISATALLVEYLGTTPLWVKMPHVMIEKCAESRALRRAFPADLSGIYTVEEMDQEVVPVAEEQSMYISDFQVRVIKELIGTDKVLETNVLKYIPKNDLKNLTADRYEGVIEHINKYLTEKKSKQ